MSNEKLADVLRKELSELLDCEWKKILCPVLLKRIGLYLDEIKAPDAAAAQARSCTCHPDDNPPKPCARKYAYSECSKVPPRRTPMADLDTLRPEVQEALKEIEFACTVRSSNEDEYGTIRSELLRLAHDCAEHAAWRDINERARFDQQQRAENAEAELAESRETIKRLNRRAQVAEAGVVEKVREHAGGSLGRALANAAADMYMRERDEAQAELAALKARIAESAHVDVTLGCAIDDDIPGDLALCRVALVKVED